jgi:hypothetical protein
MSETGTTGSASEAEFTPRELLAGLLYRAELDPLGLGASLKQNPQKALEDLGFTTDDAQSLLGGGPGVASIPGGLAGQCFDTTCFISITNGCVGPSIPGIPGLCSGAGQCKFFSIG